MNRQVVNLNLKLYDHDLVVLTWGNASIIDRKINKVYIKPSGVNVYDLKTENVSVVDLDGNLLSGKKPSVDVQTHLELYKGFDNITTVIHTHSLYCTVFAQLQEDIPCLGTTHADYFYGSIPVVDNLDSDLIINDYEKNTGIGIVKYFNENNINPMDIPAALVPRHGVFAWGANPTTAFENAFVAEHVAKMAYMQRQYDCIAEPIDQTLLDKHFLRKHGSTKYYGQ